MNAGVPRIAWLARLGLSTSCAIPKSITRGPSGDSSTFDGLRSRWITPAPWMAWSAVAIPTASASRLPPVSGPCSRTARARSGPFTYSVTR